MLFALLKLWLFASAAATLAVLNQPLLETGRVTWWTRLLALVLLPVWLGAFYVLRLNHHYGWVSRYRGDDGADIRHTTKALAKHAFRGQPCKSVVWP